jgi:hypothetical protein
VDFKVNNKIIRARINSEGNAVRVFEDGREELLPIEPIPDWSDEQIEAAARSDPDNLPLTKDQLVKNRARSEACTSRFARGREDGSLAIATSRKVRRQMNFA